MRAGERLPRVERKEKSEPGSSEIMLFMPTCAQRGIITLCVCYVYMQVSSFSTSNNFVPTEEEPDLAAMLVTMQQTQKAI